jgi:hypothetical protein
LTELTETVSNGNRSGLVANGRRSTSQI